MIRFGTIETIRGNYLEVALQSQVVKPCSTYDGATSGRLKVRIELVHATRKRQASSVTELFNTIEELGIAAQEYVAHEPVTFARAVSFLEDEGSIIYKHPLFEALSIQYNFCVEDYLPKWESPFLIWYVVDYTYKLNPLRERRISVS